MKVVERSRTRYTAPGNPNRPKKLKHTVKRSLTINRSLPELYRFCENLQNFFQWMNRAAPEKGPVLNKIRGSEKTRKNFDAPDLEITSQRENELISWRTLKADCAGSIQFQPAPGKRGTEITLTFSYNPPAWHSGFDGQIEENFHSFKQFMETGEIPKSEPDSSGS